MKNMVIIGITGTLGAGKGTIVDYLVSRKHFVHYSVRDFLIREIEGRGMKVDRDSMTQVANELRNMHTPSYITDQLYEEARKSALPCVIESIRTPGEIASLRSKGNFYLFAVDAEPKLRYARISQRASVTDAVSYETFLSNEQREMNTDDPNKQNLSACISQADFVFINNSDVENLIHQVEKAIQTIENKQQNGAG